MARTVREIMATEVVTCDASASIVDVAQLMRDQDVGDVLVTDDNRLMGIVTDRDIVVRGIARGAGSVDAMTAAEVASKDIATVQPDTDAEQAAQLMRESSIRRLPVVEGGSPVGIISIGDLAIERDPGSALADISSMPPNNT
jgi:CBS domain-containing protein